VVLLSRLARYPELDITQFIDSPLFSSLLMSLQVDRSTTVFSVGINVLIMMLPKLAVDSPKALNDALPRLLAILARVVCWGQNSSVAFAASQDARDINSTGSESSSPVGASSASRPCTLLPETKWTVLGSYSSRFLN